MAKIALDKYLQENKTFKFWTFLLFSVLLLLFSYSVTIQTTVCRNNCVQKTTVYRKKCTAT